MKSLTLRLLAMLVLVLGATSATAVPIVHVTDAAGVLGTVNVDTGNVDLIGPIQSPTGLSITMTDIALNSSGDLYGIDYDFAYSIDKTTAVATLIGPHMISGGNGLTFGTNGVLYGAGVGTSILFAIDLTTGNGLSLGQMGIGLGFKSDGDLEFHGGVLYLASANGSLVEVDPDNPALSMAVGPLGVDNTFGLASTEGTLYGFAGTNSYEIDLASGAATNPLSFAGQGLNVANGATAPAGPGPGPGGPGPGPIPEPRASLVFALGMVLVGTAARRRTRSSRVSRSH